MTNCQTFDTTPKMQTLEGYALMEPVGGLGEAFVAGALTKSYKQKFNKKVLFITSSPAKFDLLKTFKDIDEVLLLNMQTANEMVKQLITQNEVIDINIYKEDGYIASDMVDRTKHCLGLNNEIELEKPFIPEETNTKAKLTFEMMGLKEGKTVLISPYANSCNFNLVDESLWIELANAIEARGYDVVFNTNDNLFKDFHKIYLPITQMVHFSKLCSNVISFRSGLVDLLAGTIEPKIAVIYPASNQLFSSAFSNNDLAAITKRFYKYNDSKSLIENFLDMELINVLSDCKNIKQILFDANRGTFIEKCLEILN